MNQKEKIEDLKSQRNMAIFLCIFLFISLWIVGVILNNRIDKLEFENELLIENCESIWTLKAECTFPDFMGHEAYLYTEIKYTNFTEYLEEFNSGFDDEFFDEYCEILE